MNKYKMRKTEGVPKEGKNIYIYIKKRVGSFQQDEWST